MSLTAHSLFVPNLDDAGPVADVAKRIEIGWFMRLLEAIVVTVKQASNPKSKVSQFYEHHRISRSCSTNEGDGGIGSSCRYTEMMPPSVVGWENQLVVS